LLAPLLFAQKLAAQEYEITKLALNLPQEEPIITNITTDKKEMLWFTANSTLFRFDGFRSVDMLKDFKVKGNQLFPDKILATTTNEIIFSSYQEIYKLDLLDWELINISPPFFNEKRTYNCNQIKEMHDGSLVFLYESGEILRYRQENWSQITALMSHAAKIGRPVSANKIIEEEKYVWVATSESSLLRITKANWNTTVLVPLLDTREGITNLVPGTDGFWVEVEKGGMYFFDGKVMLTKQLPIDKSLFLDIHVTAETSNYIVLMNKEKLVVVAKNGANLVTEQKIVPWGLSNLTGAVTIKNQLIVASTKGVYQLRPKQKTFDLLPFPKGRTSARGIHVFKDGAIWLHSYGGALYVAKEGRVKHFKEFDSGYAMLPLSETKLLLGTEGEFLKIFDKESESLLDFGLDSKELEKLGKDGTYVVSMSQDAHHFYLGTYNGLWKLHKQKKTLSRFGHAKGEDPTLGLLIRHITVQDSGGIQISGSQGYMAFLNGKLVQSYPQNGKQGVYSHSIVENTVWLATQGSGVVGLDRKSGAVVHKKNRESGLASDLVYDLLAVDDRLLALTDAGVSIFENDGGLATFAGQKAFAKMEFNHGAQYYDAQRGQLYLGGVHGFAVLSDKRLVSANEDNVPLFISEMLLPNTTQKKLTHNYSMPYTNKKELEMSASEDMVSFQFGRAITAEPNGLVLAEVKGKIELEQLISIDQPYVMVGLAPGKYNLKIKPSINGGMDLLDFVLIKRPYFYSTWWFAIVVVICMATIFLWWYRLKKTIKEKELEYRRQIAADLHDEVGTHLSTLVLESQWMKVSEESDALKKFSDDVQRISTDAMRGMREIISISKQKNMEWTMFVAGLKSYVHQDEVVTKVSVSFRIAGTVPKTHVPTTVGHHLPKIYKELIVNILKHAQATEIQVGLVFEKKTFTLTISDNGLGFNKNDATLGNGIKNIHMRIARLGGLCFFDSKNTGTTCIINLKL